MNIQTQHHPRRWRYAPTSTPPPQSNGQQVPQETVNLSSPPIPGVSPKPTPLQSQSSPSTCCPVALLVEPAPEAGRFSLEQAFFGPLKPGTTSTDFSAPWSEKLGIQPSEYLEELCRSPKVKLGGGALTLEKVDGEVTELGYQLRLADPKGVQVGRMTRRFRFRGEHEVHHGWFQLRPEVQGKGLAKDLLADSVRLYDRVGVNKVTLYAGLEIGGYAWAKYGFKPKDTAAAAELYDEVRKRLKRLNLPESQKKVVHSLVEGDRPEAIWAISDLSGVEVLGAEGKKTTLAKALLSGTHWNGTLRLDDPVARSRFEQYINKGASQ